MARFARFSVVNPQWEEFVSSQPILANFRNSNEHIIEKRAAFQRLSAEGPQIRHIPGSEEIDVQDLHIKARDNYEILVRLYTPHRTNGVKANQYPLFVYYHGGGYTFGGIETGDDNCRIICAAVGLIVLNVDYRLAPKFPFPKGIEDSYDVLKWVVKPGNAASIRADLFQGFIVGGVSAGGNFAGVLAYLARDEKLSPPITGLMLSIPCCLMPQAFDLVPQWKDELLSVEQNKNTDMMDLKSYNQLIQDIYQAPPDDPRLSFLLNPDHSGLPTRAYFQVCGLDLIRDEALLFARLIREKSNAATKVDIYDGLPHGFWRFQELPAAKRWADDFIKGTRFLLEGGESSVSIKGYEDVQK